jgi:TonB family protein
VGKNNQRIFQRILCGALCVFIVGLVGVVNAQNNDAKTTNPSLSSKELTNLKPMYPHMSKRHGEQGTVVLRVLVKSDGTAGTIEVKSSSGFLRLDQAAIDAVKTWRFNPAKIDGKSVDEWYQIPLSFKLGVKLE